MEEVNLLPMNSNPICQTMVFIINCPVLVHLNKMRLLRENRHIIETVITLLTQVSLDYLFWTFAAQIAMTLINLTPIAVLN